MLKFFNTQIGSIIFLAIIAILAVAVISLTVIKAVKTKKCPFVMISLSVILGVLLVGMIFISVQMGSQVPSATPIPYV